MLDTNNEFKIDPDFIFLGGISAGAILAAHTAVMDESDDFTPELWDIIQANGGIEGNTSDNHQYPTEVSGYVNFSGALSLASWIGSDDPPFISYHDEFDLIVPYGGGFATVLGQEIAYMEGSSEMHIKADELGIPNELHTIGGSFGHVSYFGDITQSPIEETATFLHDLICETTINTQEVPEYLATISVYPNPTDSWLQINKTTELNLQLTLRNAIGQQVGYWENANQIDLSYLESGVYYLEFFDNVTLTYLNEKVVVSK